MSRVSDKQIEMERELYSFHSDKDAHDALVVTCDGLITVFERKLRNMTDNLATDIDQVLQALNDEKLEKEVMHSILIRCIEGRIVGIPNISSIFRKFNQRISQSKDI